VALAAAFIACGVSLPILAVSAQDAAMHGAMDGPSGMHAMAMAHVVKMLDAVDASAEQKSRIEAILHDGFKPMAVLHGDMSATHRTLHDLLVAPTIDRAALEQLRASEIARMDQASRTMAASLADAAEVLRPDQRAKLATLIAGRPPS
jgi:Spy/CpxP family protein refolding chaperone